MSLSLRSSHILQGCWWDESTKGYKAIGTFDRMWLIVVASVRCVRRTEIEDESPMIISFTLLIGITFFEWLIVVVFVQRFSLIFLLQSRNIKVEIYRSFTLIDDGIFDKLTASGTEKQTHRPRDSMVTYFTQLPSRKYTQIHIVKINGIIRTYTNTQCTV